ncbi:MAG: hypothetical protein LCI03_04115 [Actinobacteria bacterium]|jgi:hypothetical protein|nr:hypothetical protein [Actinomycetota bacterium]
MNAYETRRHGRGPGMPASGEIVRIVALGFAGVPALSKNDGQEQPSRY